MAEAENVIRRTDSIGHAKEVLELCGVPMPRGWEIAMGMLLKSCDFIRIEGYGSNAQFVLCDEEVA